MSKTRGNVKRRKAKFANAPSYSQGKSGVVPSEFEIRSCLAKLAWDSRRAAEDYPYSRNGALSAYRCPQCARWHLTTAAQ